MNAPRPSHEAKLGESGLLAALPNVPVFPLPGIVLFPGGLLPLHVFEPRYVQMLRDALASHRRIVVANQFVGPVDANGNPPFFRVAGVGVIVDHTPLPGGRSNIVLRGEARVRLDELPFVPPYRRAAATILADEGTIPSAADVTALTAVAASFTNEVRHQNGQFDFVVPSSLPGDRAADVLAHYLVLDVAMRQRLIETRSPAERLDLTMEALLLQRKRIANDAGTKPNVVN